MIPIRLIGGRIFTSTQEFADFCANHPDEAIALAAMPEIARKELNKIARGVVLIRAEMGICGGCSRLRDLRFGYCFDCVWGTGEGGS